MAIRDTSTPHLLAEKRRYRGTGVIIAKNLILTNAHILQSVSKVLVDGKMAETLAKSGKYDLALLSVETEDLPEVQIDEPKKPGQSVFYVGNPGKVKDLVGIGVIVKIDERFIYADFLQDVNSVAGASGSGLYSMNGHLIGLKKGIVLKNPDGPFLSFSIPADKIKAFLEEVGLGYPFVNSQ